MAPLDINASPNLITATRVLQQTCAKRPSKRGYCDTEFSKADKTCQTKTETRNLPEFVLKPGTHRNLSTIYSTLNMLYQTHPHLSGILPRFRCFVDEASQTGKNPPLYFGSLVCHGTHWVGFFGRKFNYAFLMSGNSLPSEMLVPRSQKCLDPLPRFTSACVPVSCNKHNSSNMGSRFTKSRTLISPASMKTNHERICSCTTWLELV